MMSHKKLSPDQLSVSLSLCLSVSLSLSVSRFLHIMLCFGMKTQSFDVTKGGNDDSIK
jgi:hypothetical protein